MSVWMAVQHLVNLVKRWPNYYTLWPAGPVLPITFVQYLIAFCSRPRETRDVIFGKLVGPFIPEKLVKFGDPRLDRSREIPPKAV